MTEAVAPFDKPELPSKLMLRLHFSCNNLNDISLFIQLNDVQCLAIILREDAEYRVTLPWPGRVGRPGPMGTFMFKSLMTSRRFAPLFWCQLCSALNDNFLKNALAMLILFGLGGAGGAAGEHAGVLITLSGIVFIAPVLHPVGARRRAGRPLRQGAASPADQARRDPCRRLGRHRLLPALGADPVR